MWKRNNEELVDMDWFLREQLDDNEGWVDDVVGDMLDECYEPWKFGGTTFYPSIIVKEVDYALYNDIVEEEKDRIISDWVYEIDRYVPNDGDTLYDFLNADYCFKNVMSEVIWEDDEEEENEEVPDYD